CALSIALSWFSTVFDTFAHYLDVFSFFSFYVSRAPRDLHSFPTRRSSDLDLGTQLIRLSNVPPRCPATDGCTRSWSAEPANARTNGESSEGRTRRAASIARPRRGRRRAGSGSTSSSQPARTRRDHRGREATAGASGRAGGRADDGVGPRTRGQQTGTRDRVGAGACRTGPQTHGVRLGLGQAARRSGTGIGDPGA